MSGIAVGHVLRTSHFRGTSLLILIVIAEATHQDGTGAWPSVPSIARHARTTERSVYRALARLEAAGELRVERKAGPKGTNLYSIPGLLQLRLAGDDTLSGRQQKRRPLTTATGRGDTAVSPEPSLIRKEPSSARARGLRRLGEILNEAQHLDSRGGRPPGRLDAEHLSNRTGTHA